MRTITNTTKLRSAVQLTSTAKSKMIQMLQTKKANTAYFYVKGGGCNGLVYVLEPNDSPPEKTDEIIPLDNNKNLRVCGQSLIHLLGTEIGWGTDFMGQSFRFNNPNTSSSCGCGATFSSKHF